MRHIKEVARIINGLREKGKTLFIISHDLEFILESCSHVLHLENGQVREIYPLDHKGREQIKGFFHRLYSREWIESTRESVLADDPVMFRV